MKTTIAVVFLVFSILIAGCSDEIPDSIEPGFVTTPDNPPTFEATFAPLVRTSPSAAPSTSGGVCACSRDTYNCPDFSSHSAAQECYDYCRSLGKGDIHRLDRDKDGLTCE